MSPIAINIRVLKLSANMGGLMELTFIEQTEREVRELYALLEHNSDTEERQNIMQGIQERNLMLTRLMPCE
jgi:hypothetical protein